MKTVEISLSSDEWMEFDGSAFYKDKKNGILIQAGELHGSHMSVCVYVRIKRGKSVSIEEALPYVEKYPCHNAINDGVNTYNKMSGITGVRLEVTE